MMHASDQPTRSFDAIIPAAVLSGIVGFLGIYSTNGFVGFPPALILAAQLTLLALSAFVIRGRLPEAVRASWPLLLAALWMGLTTAWAGDVTSATRRWLLVFVPGLLVFWVSYADLRPIRTLKLVTLFLTAVVLASAAFSLTVQTFGYAPSSAAGYSYRFMDVGSLPIGISEGGRKFIEQSFHPPRFSGLTTNPNGVGLFSALAVVALAAWIGAGRTSRTWLYAGLTGLCTTVLVTNLSRAGIGAALAGLAMVVLLRLRCGLLARLLIACSIVFPIAIYFTATHVTDFQLPGKREVFELRERALIWQVAIRAAADVWTHGVGFGLTEEAILTPLGIRSAAHSVYLTLLVETGIVGLALATWAWLKPALAATRTTAPPSPEVVASAALLLTLFVHQAVDSSVFRFHWANFFFVYLLGVGTGCMRRGLTQLSS